MTKKTFLKVTAAVLVMAFCITTVFTGIVSADSSAICTVNGYSYYEGAKDSYVTAEVTFTSGTNFTAGSFTASATGLSLIDCTTATDGVEVYVNPANGKILFAGFSETSTQDIISFGSLTLLVKFSVTAGALAEQAAGQTWTVNITGISITNTAEATYSTGNASGTIHVHNFNGASSTSGKVTTTHCSVAGCSEVETVIDNDGTLEPNSLEGDPKRAVLSFTKDGDTVLNALANKAAVDAYDNVYFVYSYTDDIDGVNTKVTATSTKGDVINIGGTDYYAFPCGRNGGVGRMNRNVTGNFIAVDNGAASVSGDWEYSIKTYLEYLISNGTLKEKNYAKSLYNFGKYTADKLGLVDRSQYGNAKENPTTLYTLPSSKKAVDTGTDASWKVSGIKVTTGYKPKMTIKFNTSDITVTVKVYDSGELVYSKEVAIAGDSLTVSDIPAKYLTGNIQIAKKDSAKYTTYSFGKYAKAMENVEGDGDVFYWMMQYAYNLNLAFA